MTLQNPVAKNVSVRLLLAKSSSGAPLSQQRRVCYSLRDTMKVHYALAAMAASASALIAPAAMPRALVARPAPTADATVLEVPRPRLFLKTRESATTLDCIRGRVGLS